jgi:hypothetical protein
MSQALKILDSQSSEINDYNLGMAGSLRKMTGQYGDAECLLDYSIVLKRPLKLVT